MTADHGILDAGALLQKALEATGLSDFGDDTLPSRFGKAVAFLQSLALDAAGQRAAAGVCHWLLTDRLKFFEDFKCYPLAEEKIERPIFATGEGRSGTTLLHALLSVDPNARSLRFWEVMNPSPPSGVTGPDDPRRKKADDDWREINQRLPRWLLSHPYNDMLGDGLPEDERTWAFDFRVLTPTAWWRVAMAPKSSGLEQDHKAQYRVHKMMLQHCQHRRSQRYWGLKGFHQQRMRTLFETYPDARIIWIHRDPVQVTASRIVLDGELVEMLTGHVDWRERAAVHLAAVRAGYAATLADPIIDDPRIYHVRYQDFVTDPIGTVCRFYRKYDVPFTADTDAAMRTYLVTNKPDRYGKFRYSTDVIGADIEALHAEFAPYRRRFGLEIERR